MIVSPMPIGASGAVKVIVGVALVVVTGGAALGAYSAALAGTGSWLAVAGYAAEIIVQTGRPMKRTELFNALKARGIHLHGKNPGMVLSTMLWRMRSKIVRLHHYGYWVADQPFPLAGYDPSRPYTPKGAEPDERGLLDD